MPIPSNVSAAINAADSAFQELESKMQAAVAAGQAKAASEKAFEDATSGAAAAGDAPAKSKQQLDAAVAAWLTVPPVSSPVPAAPAAPVATQTVTASADAQPAK